MGQFVSPDPEDSWELLRRLDELCERFSNFPLLLGVSRKGFLGGDLTERDPISQKLAVEAVEKGVKVIRTHNPAMAKEFFQAAEKISSL